MTPEERKQFNELLVWKKSLEMASTIPLNIDQSIRGRFSLIYPSTKSATSENQAVNEGGVATYSVLKPPDGFDTRTDNGTVKYYPFYT